MHRPVVSGFAPIQGLSRQPEVKDDDVPAWLKFLVVQGLVDEEQLNVMQHGTYEALLTPLGRLFEVYRRG